MTSVPEVDCERLKDTACELVDTPAEVGGSVMELEDAELVDVGVNEVLGDSEVLETEEEDSEVADVGVVEVVEVLSVEVEVEVGVVEVSVLVDSGVVEVLVSVAVVLEDMTKS